MQKLLVFKPCLWSQIKILSSPLGAKNPGGVPSSQPQPIKTRPIYMLSRSHTFRARDMYRMKVRGWKKIFHVNGNEKKLEVAIFTPDKIDLKEYYMK